MAVMLALQRAEANSAVGLLVPHFKETAPFEFTRSVRPKAGTEIRPSFLPISVSKGEVQKGKKRFSVRKQATRRELAERD